MSYHNEKLKNILDAPVGEVIDSVEKTFGFISSLKINQNFNDNILKRHIEVQGNGKTIFISESVSDCKLLPKKLIDDLLTKKEGIGTILRKNNFRLNRRILSIQHDVKKNTLVRKYYLHSGDCIWFTISETFLLDNFSS